MPIPNDYRELLQSFATLTDQNRVNWQAEDHSFVVALAEESLYVWAGTDERTEAPFVSFALKNKRGETIDNWYLDADDEDFDFLNRLYLAAKRYSLGIPDRLARIKQQIEKGGVVGKNDV